MSILIKGMEMPTKENAVILITPNGDVWMIGDMPNEDTHLVKAGVVYIPPHGDLIDRDAVRESIKPWSLEDERNACTFGTVKKLMYTLLNDAPTIIPASEEEA